MMREATDEFKFPVPSFGRVASASSGTPTIFTNPAASTAVFGRSDFNREAAPSSGFAGGFGNFGSGRSTAAAPAANASSSSDAATSIFKIPAPTKRQTASTSQSRRGSRLSSGDQPDTSSCTELRLLDVPRELNNRATLSRKYGIFGNLTHVRVYPANGTAIIGFETHETAAKAKMQSVLIPGSAPVKIMWHKSATAGTAKIGASSRLSFSTPSSSIRKRLQQQRADAEAAMHVRSSLFGPATVQAPEMMDQYGSSAGFSRANRKPVPARSSGTTASTTEFSSVAPLSIADAARKLDELLNKKAPMLKDKYDLLDYRDKLIRKIVDSDQASAPTNSAATRPLCVGRCPDMCPEKERYLREYRRQVDPYEAVRLAGLDTGTMDHSRAVKEYARSSADQEKPLPHELRSGSVLALTMRYLLRDVIGESPPARDRLTEWFDFLWSRTRAIRKDLTQQKLVDHTSVQLFEMCTRFHIYAAYGLGDLPVGDFDQKMNTENLLKCLQSLKHQYEDMAKKGETCPNEPEFRSYEILMNIEDGFVLRHALSWSSRVRSSPPVRAALRLLDAKQGTNYIRFFKLVCEDLTYLQSCLAHRYFTSVRVAALEIIGKSYMLNSLIPVSDLAAALGFSTQMACAEFCDACGFSPTAKGVIVSRFQHQEVPGPVFKDEVLVENKRDLGLAEIIHNGPLPPFELRSPMSSFNNTDHSYVGGAEHVAAVRQAKEIDLKQRAMQLPERKELQTPSSMPVPLMSRSNLESSTAVPFSPPKREQTELSVFGNAFPKNTFGEKPPATTTPSFGAGGGLPSFQFSKPTLVPSSSSQVFNTQPPPDPGVVAREMGAVLSRQTDAVVEAATRRSVARAVVDTSAACLAVRVVEGGADGVVRSIASDAIDNAVGMEDAARVISDNLVSETVRSYVAEAATESFRSSLNDHVDLVAQKFSHDLVSQTVSAEIADVADSILNEMLIEHVSKWRLRRAFSQWRRLAFRSARSRRSLKQFPAGPCARSPEKVSELLFLRSGPPKRPLDQAIPRTDLLVKRYRQNCELASLQAYRPVNLTQLVFEGNALSACRTVRIGPTVILCLKLGLYVATLETELACWLLAKLGFPEDSTSGKSLEFEQKITHNVKLVVSATLVSLAESHTAEVKQLSCGMDLCIFASDSAAVLKSLASGLERKSCTSVPRAGLLTHREMSPVKVAVDGLLGIQKVSRLTLKSNLLDMANEESLQVSILTELLSWSPVDPVCAVPVHDFLCDFLFSCIVAPLEAIVQVHGETKIPLLADSVRYKLLSISELLETAVDLGQDLALATNGTASLPSQMPSSGVSAALSRLSDRVDQSSSSLTLDLLVEIFDDVLVQIGPTPYVCIGDETLSKIAPLDVRQLSKALANSPSLRPPQRPNLLESTNLMMTELSQRLADDKARAEEMETEWERILFG